MSNKMPTIVRKIMPGMESPMHNLEPESDEERGDGGRGMGEKKGEGVSDKLNAGACHSECHTESGMSNKQQCCWPPTDRSDSGIAPT